MCPGFDSRTRRHMWVEFVVGSLLCSERFFSGYSGFPLSSKTNTSKFQFDLETVDEEPPRGNATANPIIIIIIIKIQNALFFEHNFGHNTRFFWVTLKSIILEFSSIMCLTLLYKQQRKPDLGLDQEI